MHRSMQPPRPTSNRNRLPNQLPCLRGPQRLAHRRRCDLKWPPWTHRQPSPWPRHVALGRAGRPLRPRFRHTEGTTALAARETKRLLLSLQPPPWPIACQQRRRRQRRRQLRRRQQRQQQQQRWRRRPFSSLRPILPKRPRRRAPPSAGPIAAACSTAAVSCPPLPLPQPLLQWPRPP